MIDGPSVTASEMLSAIDAVAGFDVGFVFAYFYENLNLYLHYDAVVTADAAFVPTFPLPLLDSPISYKLRKSKIFQFCYLIKILIKSLRENTCGASCVMSSRGHVRYILVLDICKKPII